VGEKLFKKIKPPLPSGTLKITELTYKIHVDYILFLECKLPHPYVNIPA